MSAPTNRWKLGLFVAGTVLIGLGAAGYLATRTLQRETISYRSFFDEGVTGLDTGSSVSFRGVKLGNVSAIDVAPDRRHVEITYQLGVSALQRLGIASGSGKHIKMTIPPDLRVQIGSSGLTGAKYLQIDFLDAAKHPAPVLPFPVPENTIPSMPSTMDAIYRAVDQLPDLTREFGKTLEQVTQLLSEVSAEHLPRKTAATFASVDRILGSLDRKLDQLKIEELSGEARAALASVNAAMVKANRMLDHMDGDRGLLASMQRTSDALGDVATGAKDVGPGLEDTLADLRGAGAAVRTLVDALERDPDMFVKGRTKAEK